MGKDESSILKKYNNIYLEIIMRYKDHIEESESLNASDLPRLVTPDNSSVSVLCDSLREVFGDYVYERDFQQAASSAFDYVRNRITEISLPIQFWQLPEETIKREAGDSFDKAVLLCSILINLGDLDSKVVIAIVGEGRHFVVYARREGGITVFDVNDSIKEYGDVGEMLAGIGIAKDSESDAYEFNNSVYNDLL